jgi:hypothetical protein
MDESGEVRVLDEAATLDTIGRAQALAAQGDRTGARALYTEVWTEASHAGDPYWACVAAHLLAHTHREPAAQLDWHRRALHAADAVQDARVRAFYPSLHANLADVYLRLDEPLQARGHLDQALKSMAILPEDGYDPSVGFLIARLSRTLADDPAPG